MKARHAIAAALCLPAAGAGCEAVIGANFDATEHSCSHKSPPRRPVVTGASQVSPPAWVAITALRIGDDPGPDDAGTHRTIGFDLDNNCSNIGQRPTCTPFAWANPYQKDGIDGIDNNGGALMRAQESVFHLITFTSATATADTRGGFQAPLGIIRFRGFNNRFDDDEVELDWYVAHEYGQRPSLDGTDEWPLWDGTIDQGAVVDGGDFPPSRFRDPHAYVANYKLVARLPTGTPIKLANTVFVTEGFTLELQFGRDLTRPVSGVLGGHVRATELFRGMPRMVHTFLDGGSNLICMNDSEYPRVKKYFCSFIDSLADGRNDPSAPCDAISLGIEFDLTPVNPGPLRPEDPFDGCAPSLDPATDTCADASNAPR